MKPIIEVSRLSKKFLLNSQNHRSASLKETLSTKLKSWISSHPSQSTQEEFWALKDVSFQVYPGDRLGIIGNNGAGKSTLLKILSRIFPPTSGSAYLRGRLASLLEVGTGFHPELSGRDNIYLNGTILGMSQKEIQNRFEEIVDFAGIERFLDTPIKKYSSGMFARLGFSIAAHLDPSILIVDEVLSVGDMQFQEKCLKKLDRLSGEGTTVLFVSHNIGAILSVCNKGLYLKAGQVVLEGSIEECVQAYTQQHHQVSVHWAGSCGDETVCVRELRANFNEQRDFIRQGEPMTLEMDLEIFHPVPGLILGFDIFNCRGHLLISTRTTDAPQVDHRLGQPGCYTFKFHLDSTHLRQGEYRVQVFCLVHNEKTIPVDAAVIHLSVYPPVDDARFSHSHRCEGIFVGNQWELS